MKRVFAALGWLILFISAGAAGADLVATHAVAHHPLPEKALAMVGGLGAEAAVNLWGLALCFGRLPGARAKGRVALGLAQGLWGMAGFALTLAMGGALFVNIRVAAAFRMLLLHPGAHPYLADSLTLTGSVVSGELMAALFLARLLRRLGRASADASPQGVAWRAAPAAAYAQAVLLALALAGVVAGLFRLVPPDLHGLQDLPAARLFEGPPTSMALMLGVVLLLGPALEEIAFRGIGFAGVAARLGPRSATIITTLLFLAAHAPEKLHYTPGFIDVGLLALAACYLRLRHGSIRPGILLHVLYNGLGLAAAAGLH